MRFGAPVWPFKWDQPYDDAVRRISRLGVRAVELIGWTRRSLDEYYRPSTIANLRAIVEGEGLVLSQFVSTPAKMASGDPAERAGAVEHFKRQTDVGAALGATLVNSVTHYPFDIAYRPITDRPHMQQFSVEVEAGLDWDQNWRDYVAAIRECARYAESAGLRFSLEPHPFRYGANADGLLRLIEAVGSPALGVNVDPSHLFPVGEMPHVVLYRLGERVLHCHVSDNDGMTNVHWRPGKGKIDWAAVFVALREIGYDGVVSLEFEDVPGVSRPNRDVPGVYRGLDVASEEFEKEYLIALEYLTGLAKDAGLHVE